STDVVVGKVASLGHRELEYLLCARGIRKVGTGCCRCLSLLYRVLDFLLYLIEVHAEVLEHRRSDALALTDQPEQYVLGADVFVPETLGLFPRHGENFS